MKWICALKKKPKRARFTLSCEDTREVLSVKNRPSLDNEPTDALILTL